MKALTLLGTVILAFGLILIAASLTTTLPQVPQEGSSSFTGCIVIFFIPICFGSGSFNPVYLEALAVVTLLIPIAFFILILYMNRKAAERFE